MSTAVRWEIHCKSAMMEYSLEGGRVCFSCFCSPHTHTRTHTNLQRSQSIFYTEHKLSLGVIAALARALSRSFVSCFYLILFFDYSAKHIHLGRVRVDLSLWLSQEKGSELKTSLKAFKARHLSREVQTFSVVSAQSININVFKPSILPIEACFRRNKIHC